MLYGLALLAGVVAGSRVFTALAAVSWAARLGGLNLGDSWLAFMGYSWTPWIFTLLAIVELVTDQLPSTPSTTYSSTVKFSLSKPVTRRFMGSVMVTGTNTRSTSTLSPCNRRATPACLPACRQNRLVAGRPACKCWRRREAGR